MSDMLSQEHNCTRFGRLIGAVYRHWRREIDVSLKSLGLTDATRTPLIELYLHDALRR